MTLTRPALRLPPPPPGPGPLARILSPLWRVADAAWAAPGLAAHALAAAPGAFRRAPEAILDLGVSALLLGFRRPLVTASLVALATAGPLAATAAVPLLRTLEATPTSGPPAPASQRGSARVRRDGDLARRPSSPAPEGFRDRLAALDPGFPLPVGIAVMDVESGWLAAVQGDRAFPQQSVSKLWVAMTVLDAVDAGRLSLDSRVTLTDADRSVFNQPVTHLIENGAFETTVGDLIRRALIQSDNAANDKLMGLAGGPAAVQAFLASRGVSGVHLAEDERRLQARIAGLTWSQDLSVYGAFEAARARLDPEARAASLAAYAQAPFDGATPAGVVRALAALQRGELLSPASTNFILETLGRTTTGPMRLKGGLAPGWKVAHKTGTGQDFRGETFGLNDVGLVTAPDGRVYAVAVFAPRVPKGSPERLRVFRDVSAALVSQWSGDPAGAGGLPAVSRAD